MTSAGKFKNNYCSAMYIICVHMKDTRKDTLNNHPAMFINSVNSDNEIKREMKVLAPNNIKQLKLRNK